MSKHTPELMEACEKSVRACNAHEELVEALKAMLMSHGMHGPCEQNSCKSCERAYNMACAILHKVTAVRAAIAKAEDK